MVVLEAAASGCPIVGTRVGVVSELGEGARAVPPGDPQALAAALLGAIGDEEARQRMGGAAMRVARERFSLEACVGGFREVYEEVGRR
jgi:rhamnosyl/mannosyltransferase